MHRCMLTHTETTVYSHAQREWCGGRSLLVVVWGEVSCGVGGGLSQQGETCWRTKRGTGVACVCGQVWSWTCPRSKSATWGAGARKTSSPSTFKRTSPSAKMPCAVAPGHTVCTYKLMRVCQAVNRVCVAVNRVSIKCVFVRASSESLCVSLCVSIKFACVHLCACVRALIVCACVCVRAFVFLLVCWRMHVVVQVYAYACVYLYAYVCVCGRAWMSK